MRARCPRSSKRGSNAASSAVNATTMCTLLFFACGPHTCVGHQAVRYQNGGGYSTGTAAAASHDRADWCGAIAQVGTGDISEAVVSSVMVVCIIMVSMIMSVVWQRGNEAEARDRADRAHHRGKKHRALQHRGNVDTERFASGRARRRVGRGRRRSRLCTVAATMLVGLALAALASGAYEAVAMNSDGLREQPRHRSGRGQPHTGQFVVTTKWENGDTCREAVEAPLQMIHALPDAGLLPGGWVAANRVGVQAASGWRRKQTRTQTVHDGGRNVRCAPASGCTSRSVAAYAHPVQMQSSGEAPYPGSGYRGLNRRVLTALTATERAEFVYAEGPLQMYHAPDEARLASGGCRAANRVISKVMTDVDSRGNDVQDIIKAGRHIHELVTALSNKTVRQWSNSAGGGAATCLFAILRLAVGTGGTDADYTCAQRPVDPSVIVSARWAAGARKPMPRRSLARENYIEQCRMITVEFKGRVCHRSVYYAPSGQVNAANGQAATASRPFAVHASILQRPCWTCTRNASGSGRARDVDAARHQQYPAQGSGRHRQHNSRRRCRHDHGRQTARGHLSGGAVLLACQGTQTPHVVPIVIYHHPSDADPNRDGNDRVDNLDICELWTVFGTLGRCRTEPPSSSSSPSPLPVSRWQQDISPVTSDPTLRAEAEGVRSMRRKEEAPIEYEIVHVFA